MRLVKLAIVLSGLYSSGAFADELLELEGTSIHGDQEQPQVLYLIPWKTPEQIDISISSDDRSLEGVLTPIDRQVFREQLYYRETLTIGDLGTD